MRVLHLDSNHPLLIEQFDDLGFVNDQNYSSSKAEIEEIIHKYDGIIVRSRLPIDRVLLDKALNLKFIGRLGAGLENIDVDYARGKDIFLAAAPEGNRNAVGEQCLGMILNLLQKANKADREVRQGQWDREGNRGEELDGKVVGIIGYGNTGKAFARKLSGFDVEVICYDIIGGVGDEYARQVGMMEIFQKSEVLSLHVPETSETVGMINSDYLSSFQKDIWLLNTARGKCVVTKDLVSALRSKKVKGAALDVLEYEKSSFETLFDNSEMPSEFEYLINANNVVLSPHVAGWTIESKIKLAQTVADKIRERFC
ncbi:MAG: 2-hydroxyacid dehydrogenase [Flavobacteriaceae bacterium]